MPAYVGTITDIVIVLILIFSFIGGVRGGAVKEFFGLLAFLLSIPLAGMFCKYLLSWFSFVSDSAWRGFLTFLLTMAIIIIIIYLILWIPRHFLEKVWNGGFFFGFLGGVFGLINAALGLVFVISLLDIYPVFPLLDEIFVTSGVLNWLVNACGAFILTLLRSSNLTGLTASISFFAVL
jgi:uncharacterized membrane protein required for colicin V production